MARIDLKKSSGLPILIENDELLSQDISFESQVMISIADMRPQLLNMEVNCPEIFVRKYKNIDHEGIYREKNLSINLYIVMPNLAGIEFVKTKANISVELPRLIEIVHGGGTAVLQKFTNSVEGDIIVSSLKKGQKIIIPPDYDFSISNTKSSILVFVEYCKLNTEIIDSLDDINGMSYYVIRKNAKQEVVRNPFYKLAKAPRKVNWEKVLLSHNITYKTPLIKQILRKYEKFDWLFNSSDISV